MSKWLFDKTGSPVLILDNDKIRSENGDVKAWITGNNVHSLNGRHIGWYEDGTIYDNYNKVLAFSSGSRAYRPYTPGLSGTPGIPGFAGVPGKPGLAGTPGRPGYGGFSDYNPTLYFE